MSNVETVAMVVANTALANIIMGRVGVVLWALGCMFLVQYIVAVTIGRRRRPRCVRELEHATWKRS